MCSLNAPEIIEELLPQEVGTFPQFVGGTLPHAAARRTGHGDLQSMYSP
jgi:hypothetical protein